MDYNKKINIPFGAKDSELKGWEYTIPEGMEAIIKDGKVVVRQKENEDERIRKEIIDFIEWADCRNTIRHDYHQAKRPAVWIDYLERQKEQKDYCKLYEDISKSEWFKKAYAGKSLGGEFEQKERKPVQDKEEREYVRTLKSLIADFLRDKEEVDRGYYQDIYDWLDGRHIEQKPAEWSEDYREEDLRTRFAFYTYKDEDDVLYLSNVFVEEASRNKGFGTKILAAAEKVAETIGAISIRLKAKQNSPANAWYRKHGYGYMASEDSYDWLEKTLEYLKPVKQEWGEEDEKMLQALIHDLGVIYEKVYPYNVNLKKELNWLKSLRPKPHWKPSEEQMKHLKRCFSHGHTVGLPNQHVLESLYHDLQNYFSYEI